MKKAIIIIVSVLVVLGAVFAGLWFFTGVFNFLKPSSNNFSIQLDKILGFEENLSYSEYEADLEKFKGNGSYTADFNMKMSVNVPSSYIDYSTQKLLNSSSLKLKSSNDANSKKSAVELALSKDNKEVLKAQAVLDGEKISINSSDLYEKYLTFDLNEYESFCKENGIKVDEDAKAAITALSKMNDIDTSNYLYDLLYISKDDFNALQKRYDNILTTIIDADKFTTKKNQKISYAGDDDVKVTAHSVTLTGKDAYDMTNKLVDLLKLIVEKYNVMKKYSNSYAEVYADIDENYSEFPDLSESDIDSLFSELKDTLKDSKDNFKDAKNALKVTIYSNSKNEPIKLEMAILDDEKDDEGSVIFTEELEKGKNTYSIDFEKLEKVAGIESSSYHSSSSSVSSIASSISQLKIVDKYESRNDSRTGTLTVSAKVSGSKSFEEVLNIDYEIINSKSEQKLKLSATSPLSSALSLNFEYDATGLDSDTQNLKLSLSAKYSSYSVAFDIDGSIKSSADIPEITTSNSVNVLSLSKEEFQKLYKDVVNNAADNLPSKLSTYGIKVTKNDILSLLPKEDPDTTETTTTENNEPAQTPAA